MLSKKLRISGSGSYLPGKPIPFDEIDDYLGKFTSIPPKINKWLSNLKSLMKEMLDIEYYHYAIDKETGKYFDDNITMATKAAKKALEKAGKNPGDVELIIYASAHMDQMPTASVRIQEELGIDSCSELSIHANCTSAYKALLLASDLIRIGRYNNALVISSSISSSELRASYYNQELVKKEDLFLRYFLCDGSGALFIEGQDDYEPGNFYLEDTYMESIGGKKPSIMYNKRPAYWMNPQEEYNNAYHHLSQMFQDKLRSYFHDKDGTVFYKGLKRMIDKLELIWKNLSFFRLIFLPNIYLI